MSFGEKLRKLRRERNLSQDQLGKILGTHGRHISKYETGQVMPAAETLLKISEYFGVTIDYLLSNNSLQLSSVKIRDKNLLTAIEAIDQMTEEDKFIVKSLIDAFIKRKQLTKILEKNLV